jgi:NAD(P)-dependent dehydrogenase (short-subunit alcohol dehydrogenase family)
MADENRSAEYRELINECKSDRSDRAGWAKRIRGIQCDGRAMSSVQAALAEAEATFGGIDILLCNTSEAVVGSVEELGRSERELDLVRHQMEVVYYGNINYIKTILPGMRGRHNGHIIMLTGIGGHIGTPGMPIHAAATWAIEGFCDSIAYEIAPFNIKMTIVQPNMEVGVLSNRIIFAPRMTAYDSQNNPAPNVREILGDVAGYHPADEVDENGERYEEEVVSVYPVLPSKAADELVIETVHALTAIGGHENPPARHIVGNEGVMSVKEKLKTVSEELEDFVEASLSADGTYQPDMSSPGELATGTEGQS